MDNVNNTVNTIVSTYKENKSMYLTIGAIVAIHLLVALSLYAVLKRKVVVEVITDVMSLRLSQDVKSNGLNIALLIVAISVIGINVYKTVDCDPTYGDDLTNNIVKYFSHIPNIALAVMPVGLVVFMNWDEVRKYPPFKLISPDKSPTSEDFYAEASKMMVNRSNLNELNYTPSELQSASRPLSQPLSQPLSRSLSRSLPSPPLGNALLTASIPTASEPTFNSSTNESKSVNQAGGFLNMLKNIF